MLSQLIIRQLIGLKNWGLLILLLVFISCNQAQKNAKDAIKNSLEKAIEEKSGTKVDYGNADAYSESSGTVSFKTADKVYLKNEEKLQSTVIFQKEKDVLSISFQLSDENGKALIAMLTHVPPNFTLPLTAKFAVSNSYDGVNPVATFIFMHASENALLNSPMPFEGTLTIIKLTDKEITFEMDGKGGQPENAETPANWKSMSAKGILNSPLIQTYGIDKKEVFR